MVVATTIRESDELLDSGEDRSSTESDRTDASSQLPSKPDESVFTEKDKPPVMMILDCFI